MSDVVIRVDNLGKKYIISHQQESYRSFRDAISEVAKSATQKLLKPVLKGQTISSSAYEEFWALKEVSFEIEKGDRVGIIGRNGAGKSTLLKILSRITEPTKGRISIKGRVASLLEVGTGFHPELTGRENIYLNGAILGMSKVEIKKKFDEIVAFAEVEKFLDTPVKRYSSGMYVRLAFAVAAHLEPEILVVDEVLAVGDSQFQKKCLGKMEEVGKEGRTVLFVSHNMSSLMSLCDRGILLHNGSMVMTGKVQDVVAKYLDKMLESTSYLKTNNITQEWKKLEIIKISLLKNDIPSSLYYCSETLVVRIEYVVRENLNGAQIALEVLTELNECLFSTTNQDWDGIKEIVHPGIYVVECPINLNFFREGRYQIQISSSIPAVEILDILQEPLVFEVYDDSSPLLKLGQMRRGIILPIIQWRKV